MSQFNTIKDTTKDHALTAVKIKKDASGVWIRLISYVFITVFAILCIFPFWLMIAASFTPEREIAMYGFSIWPREFSIRAYEILTMRPELLIGSYAVTIAITVIGTAVGLFVTAMTGYALQRQDFRFRNGITLFIYFTTLFGGGIVPYYLMMVLWFGLKDNYLAILLPSLLSAWNIVLMKNFTKSIPHSITESALIDGANDFYVFLRIILPMSAPALATIGLFIALNYWNEWFNGMLFLTAKTRYKPLQLFLYNTITTADSIKNTAAAANVRPVDIPTESMKMATAVFATGPIVLVYPFVQRYFIKGITIGSVKG